MPVKSSEATVDQMDAELQSLEQTLKRYDTSGVEAALQIFLHGSARIELKIGRTTERVNTGDERMRRIAQIDERTQLLKKKLDVLVNAGNERMGQLEEDSAQINENIRDLIDVLTIQND